MSEKKHPILTVIIILGIVVIFLGLLMGIIVALAGPSMRLSFGEKIGIILIEGPIRDASSTLTQLDKFKKDKKIKAIILRIDSPGGGVGPSQEIYREITRTRRVKKVVASMGSVAASGGYYIASAANKIVANPGTITGSIGVIMEFVRLEELLKKLGVGLEVLKTGEFKDIGSPHRKMSDREKALVRDLIFEIKDQFVLAVAKGRNLSKEKVEQIADGRILTGAQAKNLDLVDMLGNFQDAVELTKRMTGIRGEAILVYPKRRGSRFWDYLFEDKVRAIIRTVKNELNTHLEYRWDGFLN